MAEAGILYETVLEGGKHWSFTARRGLTRGHCLYSDMGRIFCSIVADSTGWHDTVAGNANPDAARGADLGSGLNRCSKRS